MSGRSHSVQREYLCLLSRLHLHCRKYKKRAGMETIGPGFSTCHCYEVAGGGCAASGCLRNRFQAMATPCTLHVWADTRGCSPSSITARARARLSSRCTPHLISLMWDVTCYPHGVKCQGKYRKASLSCKLSCSLSPSLNILVTALYFSLRAAALSVSRAIFLNWVHFCMAALAMSLKSREVSMLQWNALCPPT